MPPPRKRRAVAQLTTSAATFVASTAIEHTPQAQHLLPPLIAWLGTQGVRFRHKNFRLELLDRTDFLSREGGRRDPLGLTTSTRHMRNRRVDHAVVDSIAILKACPQHCLKAFACMNSATSGLCSTVSSIYPSWTRKDSANGPAHRHYLAIGSKADRFMRSALQKTAARSMVTGFANSNDSKTASALTRSPSRCCVKKAATVKQVNRMKITRIYTDADGETHFGELDIPLKDAGTIGLLSQLQPATGIIFRETPARTITTGTTRRVGNMSSCWKVASISPFRTVRRRFWRDVLDTPAKGTPCQVVTLGGCG